MAISADSPAGGAGAPFAKFNRLGDKLVGAFASHAKESQRQKTKFKTGELVYKSGKNGEQVPALEEVMHFVAMPGTTAQVGTVEAGYEPVEAGTHVRFSVSGFNWGQVIDQRKKLPARAGFKEGEPCSGDVYVIELVGWSVATENPGGAERAGFTVQGNRIVMRTEEEREKYVLHQTRSGGNSNTGKDIVITVRRPSDDEKRWEQAADELYTQKPWKKQLATVGGGGSGDDDLDNEPF